MPKYAVKQPNGKYAAFSTVVDSFTVYDQTRDEAWIYWRDQCGARCADGKLDRADNDGPLLAGRQGDGTLRWRDSLTTMLVNEGRGSVEAFVRDALEDDKDMCLSWLRWLDTVEVRCDDPSAPDVVTSVSLPPAPEGA